MEHKEHALYCKKCKCSKVTGQGDNFSVNVGEMMDETGWTWLPQHDGGSSWFCPECWVKLKEASAKILEFLGDSVQDFSLWCIHIRIEKEKEKYTMPDTAIKYLVSICEMFPDDVVNVQKISNNEKGLRRYCFQYCGNSYTIYEYQKDGKNLWELE